MVFGSSSASFSCLVNSAGVIFGGDRYDTGDRLSYLKAVVTLASRTPDIGGEFGAWLADFVKLEEFTSKFQ